MLFRPWLYVTALLLIGILVGATAVAWLGSREEASLLNDMTAPIGVLGTCAGLYMAVYEFERRHSTSPIPPPPRRWSCALAAIIGVAAGVLGFHTVAIAKSDHLFYFDVHDDVWKKPCIRRDDAEVSPNTRMTARSICRVEYRGTVVDIYVLEYVPGAIDVSRPKQNPQVFVLGNGKWTGPEKTAGIYTKYIFHEKADGLYSARFWLEEPNTDVALIASVDTPGKPSEKAFSIAQTVLFGQRYRLKPAAY